MNSKLLIERISQRLLLEVKKKQFEKDLVDTGIISREEYESKIFNIKRGRPIMPFADANFLQMLYNSYMAKQNHSVQDFIDIFRNVKTHILDPFVSGRKVFVDVPGGERISIESLDTLTFDEASNFLSVKEELNLSSKRYIKCIEKQDPKHFEIILDDSEWVVTYPKTILASISLARAYWDGQQLRYDETFTSGKGQNTGIIRWCTSISSGGNMFLNYHRKLNLHMYYCINKNPTSITDVRRKLCISLNKQNNVVNLAAGSATVNAENKAMKIEDVQKVLGDQRLNMLKDDAKKPERLEIDIESYYKSISLEQYITLREANEENIDEFIPELNSILAYSKDKEKIATHALNDKNTSVFECALENSNLSNEYFINAASSEDEDKVKSIIQHRKNKNRYYTAREDRVDLKENDEFIKVVLENPSLSDKTKAESIKIIASMEMLKSISQDEYFSNKEFFMQNIASVLDNRSVFQNKYSKEEIQDFLVKLFVIFKEKNFSTDKLYRNKLASKEFSEACLEWYVDNSDDMSKLKLENSLKQIDNRSIVLKIARKADNEFANNMIKNLAGHIFFMDEEILCTLLEKHKNIFKKEDCYNKKNIPILSSNVTSGHYKERLKLNINSPSERVLNLLLDQQSLDTKFSTYIQYAHKFGYEKVYNFLEQNIKTLEKSSAPFSFLCGLTIKENHNILPRLIVDFCNISEKFKIFIDKNIDKVISQTNQESINVFIDSLKQRLVKDYKLSCKLARNHKPKNENDDILDFIYNTYKGDKKVEKALFDNHYISSYIFNELVQTKKATRSVKRKFVIKNNCPDEYIIDFIKSAKHYDDLRFVFTYNKQSLSSEVLSAGEEFIFSNLDSEKLSLLEKIALVRLYAMFQGVRLEKVFEMYDRIKNISPQQPQDNLLSLRANIELLYSLSTSFLNNYSNKADTDEILNKKILQALNKFLPERIEDLNEDGYEKWKIAQAFGSLSEIEILSDEAVAKIRYYIEEGIKINLFEQGSYISRYILNKLDRINILNKQKQKLTPESILKTYIKMLLS